jgi:hypothetical protein
MNLSRFKRRYRREWRGAKDFINEMMVEEIDGKNLLKQP